MLPQHSVVTIGGQLGKRIKSDVLSQSEIEKFLGFLREFQVKWAEKTFGNREVNFCSCVLFIYAFMLDLFHASYIS